MKRVALSFQEAQSGSQRTKEPMEACWTLGCHVWEAQTAWKILGEKEGSRPPSVLASQKEWVRLMVLGFADLDLMPSLLTSPSLF